MIMCPGCGGQGWLEVDYGGRQKCVVCDGSGKVDEATYSSEEELDAIQEGWQRAEPDRGEEGFRARSPQGSYTSWRCFPMYCLRVRPPSLQ